MAVPKRRHSKQRGRKRRAQWKISAPKLIPCPQCEAWTLPHRVCPECGFYKSNKVVDVEE